MRKKLWKTLKPVLLVTLVLSLAGTTAAFTWGGMGGGWGCGPGGGMGHGKGFGMGPRHFMLMNMTPEQAGQVFDLRQKFMNETADLRKQMMVKAVELAQLWKAEKPDDKAILAKVKELSALRAQFAEKAVAQRLEVRKILPQLPMFGPGMGPGMGPGKGSGKGAALDPDSENLGEVEAASDLELALNFGPGW